MTNKLILPVEKEYWSNLNAEEQRLYTLDEDSLQHLLILNNELILNFVRVSMLLYSLDNQHRLYNNRMELIDKKERGDVRLHNINDASFNMSISIGDIASIINLTVMNECDALYEYLATLKMLRFDMLLDTFSASTLLIVLNM